MEKYELLEYRAEKGRKIVFEKKDLYDNSMLKKLQGIIKNYGAFDKDNSEKHLYASVYCYWMFGCTVDEYFYYDFLNIEDEEIREYVTAHEKVLYINHLNKAEDAHILNNKWDTYKYLRNYYKRDVILIGGDKDFGSFLDFVKKHPVYVVKPTDSGLGQGVHLDNVKGITEMSELKEKFDSLLKEAVENSEKLSYVNEKSVILEEVIQQTSEMAIIHPDSVNGVRITTIKTGDKVHIYHPWFKIGRGGQFVTSAAFGTFDAGIDAQSGIVITPGFTEKREEFLVHPDTNVNILGFQIPRWDELIEVVTKLALELENINYVGWDMVLTEAGWVLMEGNYKGDFMWQLYEKHGTKKEFESLINFKLPNKRWWE